MSRKGAVGRSEFTPKLSEFVAIAEQTLPLSRTLFVSWVTSQLQIAETRADSGTIDGRYILPRGILWPDVLLEFAMRGH